MIALTNISFDQIWTAFRLVHSEKKIVDTIYLMNLLKINYDRTDSFPFDYEPNGIPFRSLSENISAYVMAWY